jgi:hypothetical protein
MVPNARTEEMEEIYLSAGITFQATFLYLGSSRRPISPVSLMRSASDWNPQLVLLLWVAVHE